ncbi:MAG: hypothetical protein KC609_22190 [Myxococcales bacterium]|nr:hypothetical protein [Myxococcales bacterium]
MIVESRDAAAHGGPPMLTDDTGTPSRGSWEILAYFTLDRRGREIWFESPVIDVTYGIGQQLSLTVGLPWTIWFRPGKTPLSGLGNIFVALKWRFFELPRQRFAIAWTPQLITNSPTSAADQGIVPRGTSFQFPLQFQKDVGPVDFVLELGFRVNQVGGHEWLYGLVIGWNIVSSFELMAEVFGLAPTKFSRTEVVFNVGLCWRFHRLVSLIASAGRSFRRSSSGESNLIALLGVGLTL